MALCDFQSSCIGFFINWVPIIQSEKFAGLILQGLSFLSGLFCLGRFYKRRFVLLPPFVSTALYTMYLFRFYSYCFSCTFKGNGGHGGRVVTLSPPTSEAGVRFRARPQVGKLVVACRWSAVYITEP